MTLTSITLLPIETRICTKCREEKALADFTAKNGCRGGRDYRCRMCNAEDQKVWRDKNIARAREITRNSARKHADRYAKRVLRNKFGIEPEDYNRMFEAQSGRCGCCQKHQSELRRRLAVDHDHSTGHIRGLLCSTCNSGIGHAHDDVKVLRAMIRYLTEARLRERAKPDELSVPPHKLARIA